MCEKQAGDVLVVLGSTIPGKPDGAPVHKGIAKGGTGTWQVSTAADAVTRAEEAMIRDARKRGANVVTDMEIKQVIIAGEENLLVFGNAWYAKHLDKGDADRRVGYGVHSEVDRDWGP